MLIGWLENFFLQWFENQIRIKTYKCEFPASCQLNNLHGATSSSHWLTVLYSQAYSI